MEDVDHVLETHRVDRTIGIAVVAFDDLENAGAFALPRLGMGMLATKLRHAEEFLGHGSKVKMRLKFRGREMAHTDIGFEVMQRAIDELVGMGHPDSPPKLAGRNINVMLTPLPANKRKPKFHVAEDDEEEGESNPGPSAESDS